MKILIYTVACWIKINSKYQKKIYRNLKRVHVSDFNIINITNF